ncbi:MAG: replicative DNA helicase [Candidatus Lindowbacteria bacterium]|nr:replicative DNA helicase [Candidatus Lindowbacteria bacterium]
MEYTPPAAIDAEKAILGAILLNDRAVNIAVDLLNPDDFYRDNNRTIFEAISDLMRQGKKIDVVTLGDHLKVRGDLDRIGGSAFLGEVARETGTSDNVEEHCKLVLEKAQLRKLLTAARAIERSVSTSTDPVSEIIENAEREIFSAASEQTSNEPTEIKALLEPTFDKIDEFAGLKGALSGITTGYEDLNIMTSGWQKSDLIILAARPSMGKTSLAVNMMEAAAATGKPIVFFSMEMGTEAVVMRFLSASAKVPFWKIRAGLGPGDEMTELYKAADRLGRTKLLIDDSVNLTPIEVRSRCRRIKSKYGEIGLIVIDYLQLMHSSRKIDNRVQEVSEISRTLKGVARELECPVLCLSQLSRAPAQRSDSKPQLSDLRDSGAIEQDADMVMFIDRENYSGTGGDGGSGPAELLIRKHRNGATGTINLVFVADLMRFYSAETRHGEEADTDVMDQAF